MLAASGQQRAARQALESAWFYSLSDPALNEDARVQLHRLAEEQALVGLVGNRGRLRQQSGVQPAQDTPQTFGENFDREQARRLRGTLSKADSENLETIIGRMIETQDEATAAGVPLMVTLPVRGRACTSPGRSRSARTPRYTSPLMPTPRSPGGWTAIRSGLP